MDKLARFHRWFLFNACRTVFLLIFCTCTYFSFNRSADPENCVSGTLRGFDDRGYVYRSPRSVKLYVRATEGRISINILIPGTGVKWKSTWIMTLLFSIQNENDTLLVVLAAHVDNVYSRNWQFSSHACAWSWHLEAANNTIWRNSLQKYTLSYVYRYFTKSSPYHVTFLDHPVQSSSECSYLLLILLLICLKSFSRMLNNHWLNRAFFFSSLEGHGHSYVLVYSRTLANTGFLVQ